MPLPQHSEPVDVEAVGYDRALTLLEQMWTIRHFENEVMDLFSKGRVRGSTHLCQGQEAVTVGVCAALRPGDTMTCTYRGHGAVLAMGAQVDRAFGEILGRAGGLCGGKGGSMHLTDVANGALGSNAIVGAHLPITVGAAFASKYRKRSDVSVAFFGDGSTNIGAFHESLNLAAVWKLPTIFVIENNQYGEYSPLSTTTPIARLADRAGAYGMPGVFIDGNNVVEVLAAARQAVDRARNGDGPTLIEANTYRQVGHSRSDPATYRPDGELEAWLLRDPIGLLRDALIAHYPSREAEVHEVESRVLQDVRAARSRAESMPVPDIAWRLEGVYA